MALPVMSLLPDNKRSLKFRLSRNGAPTLLENAGVAVYSSSSDCSPSMVTNQESRFHSFFPQTTSFHSRSKLIPSSGFLGSKSQMRSVNHPQKICDFICTELLPDLLGAATECFNKYCDISAVPSPPKKKCAKEVSPTDLTIVDTVDFPTVIYEQSSQDKIAEGLKQSYAEVAKAASSRPLKTDGSMDFGKETSRICRKPLAADHRSSRRKLKRKDRRSNTIRSSESVNLSSPSLEIPPASCKDLRLNQQEKHFSQLKTSSNRGHRKLDRLGSSTSSFSPHENRSRDRSTGSHNRHKRQSNHRSHSDTKQACQFRSIDCDIDKINWRTGEPIVAKMGTEHVDDFRENFPVERLSSESLSMEQKNDGYKEDQRSKECSPSDSTSWTDFRGASPRCRRRSIASECSVDSEDSFIIFQTNGVTSDSLSDLASDWSDCDSDESFESDSEASDEADSCDGFSTSSPRLKEVNDLWQKEYSLEVLVTPENNEKNSVKKEYKRKVCFSNSKPVVHRMLAWDYAYRCSRPGPWEEMARDRERFQTRIRQFEGIISPVLTSAHRKKIWNQLHAH